MVSMAADPKALLGRRQRKAEAGSLWKVPPPTPTWVPAAAHVLRHLHPSSHTAAPLSPLEEVEAGANGKSSVTKEVQTAGNCKGRSGP